MGDREKAVFSSHQTAKLIEAHKFTDGFAAFACRAAQKNEPPPPKKSEPDEVEGGYIFFEGGKDGTNGKTLDKKVPSQPSSTQLRAQNPLKLNRYSLHLPVMWGLRALPYYGLPTSGVSYRRRPRTTASGKQLGMRMPRLDKPPVFFNIPVHGVGFEFLTLW